MEELIIKIKSGGREQQPVVLEGVTWETARKGEPSRLTFTVVKDKDLSFSEGAEVKAWLGDYGFFYGFVFEKSRNKDQHIQVVAYDSLRYLKNKMTYNLSGSRVDQVVKRIADDFELKCGTLANTGYVIPEFLKQNQSLFDIILDAIDETVMNTSNLFYLYDDFGKLTLKNIKDSATDFLIDDETAEDFDYTSSIDGETYNRIMISSKSDGDVSTVEAFEEDVENVKKWGILQYFEEFQDNTNMNPVTKAKALLKLHNKVSRSLVIKNHIGDIKIRAGCGVIMDLNLGDKDIDKKRFLVEKAVHIFNKDHHVMDLTINGQGEFYE